MTDKKNDKIEDDDDDFEGKSAKRRKRNSFDDNIETLGDSDEELDSDDDNCDRKNKKRKRNEKSEDDETVEVGDEDGGVDEGKELDYLSDYSDNEKPLDEDVDEFNSFGQDDDDDDEEQLADDKSDDDDEEDSDGEGEKKDGGDSDSDEDADDLFIEPSGVKENTVKDNTPLNGKRKSDGTESASKKPKLEVHPVSSAVENMEDFIRDCLKEPISTPELMMKVSSQFSASLSKKELQQKLILIMKKLNPKSKNIEGAKHFFL